MSATIHVLTEMLGGRKVFPKEIQDENELIESIRSGLPIESVDALIEGFNLTAEELVAPLGISLSTIKRRHKQQRFTTPVSDRVFRLAKIVALARDTLGSREKAARWLRKPNRALSGETPLSRLDTSLGSTQVEHVLQRIEHGLFS